VDTFAFEEVTVDNQLDKRELDKEMDTIADA